MESGRVIGYHSPVEYTVVLQPDPETGTITASVAELPGCVSQANSEAEVMNDIRDAISEYLAVVAEETRGFRTVKVAV